MADEPFPKVAAERSRVINRETYVLIEVEASDAIPVDVGFFHEFGEHFELRGASGHNDVRNAAGFEGMANVLSASRGGCLSHGSFVGHNFYFHCDDLRMDGWVG